MSDAPLPPTPKPRSKAAVRRLADNERVSGTELRSIFCTSPERLQRKGVRCQEVRQYQGPTGRTMRLGWWVLGEVRAAVKRARGDRGPRPELVASRRRALRSAIEVGAIDDERPPTRAASKLNDLPDDALVTTDEVTAKPVTLWSYARREVHPGLGRPFRQAGWRFWRKPNGYGSVALWWLGEVRRHITFLKKGTAPDGLVTITAAQRYTGIDKATIVDLIEREAITGGRYYGTRPGGQPLLQWFVKLDQLDARQSVYRKGQEFIQRVNGQRVFWSPDGRDGHLKKEAAKIAGWETRTDKLYLHRSRDAGGPGVPCPELDGDVLRPFTVELPTYRGKTRTAQAFPGDQLRKIEARVKGLPKVKPGPKPPATAPAASAVQVIAPPPAESRQKGKRGRPLAAAEESKRSEVLADCAHRPEGATITSVLRKHGWTMPQYKQALRWKATRTARGVHK